METTQIQNASSTGTTPTSTTSPTSKTNTESTNAGSTQIQKVNNLKSLHLGKEMLKIEKSHKFGIILQNLMLILKFLELNVIIVENIMHVILLLMTQVICGVI